MIIATVAGLCSVAGVYNYAPAVAKWNPPPIVASLGASAVLDYNTVRSPLAQPRNSIVGTYSDGQTAPESLRQSNGSQMLCLPSSLPCPFEIHANPLLRCSVGHAISAVLGVAIANAFQMDPVFFAKYPWLAAAVACAAASVAMSMTNTVHPPGGATAILACTDKQIIALGWMFPPLILLASTIMVAVACLVNNTLRWYPVFWWTPDETGSKLPWYRKRKEYFGGGDSEAGVLEKSPSSEAETRSEHNLEREFSNEVQFIPGLGEVQVASYALRMPPHFHLSDEEAEVLGALQARLRNHSEIN